MDKGKKNYTRLTRSEKPPLKALTLDDSKEKQHIEIIIKKEIHKSRFYVSNIIKAGSESEHVSHMNR